MLLQLYLLYRKGPKRFQLLKVLNDIYKETLEIEKTRAKPKKAKGSNPISHKLASLKMLKDKWRLYIKHLEKVIEDQIIPLKVRARLKGCYFFLCSLIF